MIRRLAALAAVLSCLTSLPGAPATASAMIDPTTLPRGEDPHVVWLGGRVLHRATGATVSLPLPAKDAAQLRLLGRAHGEWVVVDAGVTTRVVGIAHGRARTFWKRTFYEPATTYALSWQGSQVVQWYSDRGGTTTATVFTLQGHKIAARTWNRFGDVLDFTDDELLLGFRKTLSWRAGAAPAVVAGSAALASRPRDVLFVYDADYAAGPTSLSAPGTPPWTAKFVPRAVSPDGLWVAGYDERTMSKLEVRSMVDGSLQPASGLRLPDGAELAFEQDSSLLAEVHTGKGSALVRCRVSGECERATDWLPSGAISFAYQPQYFGDY